MCSGGFQGTEVQLSTKADRCTEVKHRYFCHHYTKPVSCAAKFQIAMFRVGQKVVCIKPDEDGDLVKGEIYTVIDVRLSTGGVKLREAKCTGFFSGYFRPDRFRPVDNDWAEELLCKLMSEVEDNELVSA